MRRHARIHAQGSRKQPESSGEELGEDGSQPTTPPSTSPHIYHSLPLVGADSEDIDALSGELTTPESTPLRSQVPLPSPRRARSSHGSAGDRILSHVQHSRSISNEETVRVGSSLRNSDNRSRSSSSDDESRPEKRSRRQTFQD